MAPNDKTMAKGPDENKSPSLDEDNEDRNVPPKTALDPLFVYGVKPEVTGGIFFAIDNSTIIYPAGCGVARYNTKDKVQNLIPLAERGRHLTAICTNKHRKLLAFAERGDRPNVIIFDLNSRTRRKVLRCAEFASEEVISLAFSHDSKYLLAQGGAPDYSLVYFFWEKNKVITTLKRLSSSRAPVTEVSFHPRDHNVICVVGSGIFKMCRLTEGILKPFGFQKGEHHQMLCHSWLSSRFLAIGTKTGKVLLLEEAELRTTLDIYELIQKAAIGAGNAAGAPDSQHQLQMPTRERSSVSTFSVVSSSASSSVINEEKHIHAILAFKAGFICSLGSGKVGVCELVTPFKELLAEDEVKFKVSQVIRLPRVASSSSGSASTGTKESTARGHGSKVISLALNSSESLLIALTDTLQLVCFHLKDSPSTGSSSLNPSSSPASSPARAGKQKCAEFSVLCHPFHYGSITGVDMCQRKPLVVTCGQDNTIRVWNYLSLEMELSKEFEESVESVALHPTGLYILAGFFDKLRLMNLLIDDIKHFREFPIKSSSVCTFSCGGHLLAAVSGKDIQVYSSIHFKKMATLKGHNGLITSMSWSSDDRTLVSCADDGSLYEWDLSNQGKRTHELVIKSCSYNDVTLTTISTKGKRPAKSGNSGPRESESGSEAAGDKQKGGASAVEEEEPLLTTGADEQLVAYAVGSDKTIKQISNSTLIREIDLHTLTLSSMALTHDRRLLFTGSTGGRVQAFNYPLTLPGDWIEYELHGDAVTQMRLSFDNKRLVTAAKDGSLCIWEVRTEDITLDIPRGLSKAYEYANEILITKSELEEKNKLVLSLQNQVEETRTESEYQLRLKDNQHVEASAKSKRMFTEQLADLRQTIHKLQNDLENNRRGHDNAMAKLVESNEKALVEQADQFKSKLIVEYQKFETLDEKYRSLKKNYDRKMAAVEKAKEETINRIKTDFQNKLVANEQEVKSREAAVEVKIRAVEEMLKQTEEDADKEIIELKTKYEKGLRYERETNVRLRGELGIVKKKHQSALKDTEEHKNSIHKLTGENQRLQQAIRNLEKDICDLKLEIRNRDDSILEKEKRLAEQKRYAIELEKNRYVLEHKIEDLRRQLSPKDEAILDLRSQIEEMEDELNSVSKTQADLELQVQDARSKMLSSVSELSSERKRCGKQAVLVSRIQKDLSDLGGLLQDSKQLKEAVGRICKKYNSGLQAGPTRSSSSSGAGTGLSDDHDDTDEALQEILRQKAFLEKSVASLKEQMKKQGVNHRQEYERKVRENAFLIQEIQTLKKELGAVKGQRPRERYAH